MYNFFSQQSAILAVVIFFVLILFIMSLRYFFATDDDTYRSRSYRCKKCDKFKKTGSLFEGYCNLWKREVLKDSTCKHFSPKDLLTRILGKFGL